MSLVVVAFQEQPCPCVHLALDRLQLHHHVSVSSPLRPVRPLWHPAACLEPSVAPAHAEVGSTTRAADVEAGCRITLANTSRALTEQDAEGAQATRAVAAPEIDDSSCDTQLDAAGTSMNMGVSYGAVWLLEAYRKEKSAMQPMGLPVLQGDHIQTVLRSEQLRHLERHFEIPLHAQHNGLTNVTPLAGIEFCLRGEVLR